MNFCGFANEKFMVGLFHSISYNIKHLKVIHVATQAMKDSCSSSSLSDLWMGGIGRHLVFGTIIPSI